MTTVSRPRTTRKPRPRPLLSWRLHFPPLHDLPGQLTIWQGQEAQDYEIRNLPSDFGRAFTLTKLVPDEDAEPVVYSCCIEADNPQDVRTHCGCTGHERFGYCKHTRAILRLLERNELPTIHTDPEPVAGAVVDDCPF